MRLIATEILFQKRRNLSERIGTKTRNFCVWQLKFVWIYRSWKKFIHYAMTGLSLKIEYKPQSGTDLTNPVWQERNLHHFIILPKNGGDLYAHRTGGQKFLPPALPFYSPAGSYQRFFRTATGLENKREKMLVSPSRARVFVFLIPCLNKFLTLVNSFGIIILSIEKKLNLS